MESIGFIVGSELGDDVVDIVDCSKGCDQNVFLVTTEKSSKYVVKMPRKSVETRPPMHSPLHQAEVARKLKSYGLAVPEIIAVSPYYLIETCVGVCDWSKKLNNMTISQNTNVLKELGIIMRGMHQIQTKGFSYMSESIFVGKYMQDGGWLQMLKEEYFPTLEDAAQKLALTTQQQDQIKELFYSVEGYLKTFKDSRLLHGDVTPNNVRLTEDFQAYLIDFADCLCGDPLMDFGRLLVELKGDWEQLKIFLSGYQMELTDKEKKIVSFYAVGIELWLSNDIQLLYQLMGWQRD